MRDKADDIRTFAENLATVTALPADVVIVTTQDLPSEGTAALASSGLEVIRAADTTAGNVSYAGMLNAYLESFSGRKTNCVIVSPSLVGIYPEIAARQVKGLVELFEYWEKQRPGRLAMAGPLIEGEQSLELIRSTIDGTADVNFGNFSVAFPNNSLSLVRPEARFSKETDNGQLGKVWIGAECESARVGGNEEFYFAFGEMLRGKDVVLMIDQIMLGERKDKIDLGEKKHFRRQAVFEIYATSLIIEAMWLGILPFFNTADLNREQIATIVEDTLDRHLFFARFENNQVEILLTRRQRSRIPSF